MEIINKIYTDPSQGFISIQKLYQKVREIDQTITMKMVKEYLDKSLNKLEYEYYLSRILRFGKYAGHDVKWLIENDKGYADWIISCETFKDIELRNAILKVK
jgi:hypothetical protein